MNSSRWIKRWTKKNRLIKILVKSGLEFEFESRAHRDNILNSLKVNHFQGIFFFRGAQSGDQSNNKILNGFKDIYWKLIQEHPELTARQVADYYNPNASNPFALQQEDLLVWPVDKIIYGEWGRVKHEVRSPPQEVCKSFGWDRKIIRLRTFHRFPEWQNTERCLKHPSSCKVLYSSLLMWVLKDECYFLKNSGEGIREKEE